MENPAGKRKNSMHRCIAEDEECKELLSELGAVEPTLHQWCEYLTTAACKDTHIWSNLPLRSCTGPSQQKMRASTTRLRDKHVERYAVEVSHKRRKLLPVDLEDDQGVGGGTAYERSKWPDAFVVTVYNAVLSQLAERPAPK